MRTLYLALLRGINVGGNNKVEMKKLKGSFERLGLTDVQTYINSGNIIFVDTTHSQIELTALLEKVILDDFGLSIKVLLRTFNDMRRVLEVLPTSWQNNLEMKSDVMFLWDEVDSKEIVNQLPLKPEIDTVLYVPGAILWSVSRKNQSRSGMLKLIGTPLYKQMTIRNCNTVRKLFGLMEATAK